MHVCMYVCMYVFSRGSTGFGQDSIESLPGQIGRNDVDDIVSALHAVVEKFNNEGGDEVHTHTYMLSYYYILYCKCVLVSIDNPSAGFE